eukprot:354239-Chlamydomonas_euryale.AAC.7
MPVPPPRELVLQVEYTRAAMPPARRPPPLPAQMPQLPGLGACAWRADCVALEACVRRCCMRLPLLRVVCALVCMCGRKSRAPCLAPTHILRIRTQLPPPSTVTQCLLSLTPAGGIRASSSHPTACQRNYIA